MQPHETVYIIQGYGKMVKGTVSIISTDSPCKEGNARFTTVP